MSVRFVRGDGRYGEPFASRVPGAKDTLYGEPFPSEEVEAFWHMVPDTVVVNWVTGLGLFVIELLIPDAITFAGDTQYYRRGQIKAEDANKLSVWMETLNKLRLDARV